MKTDWDEMIFENRNHAYGAYRLRKSYHRNMTYAMCICIGLVLLSSWLLQEKQNQWEEQNLFEMKEEEKWIENIPLEPPPKLNNNTIPAPKIKTQSREYFKVVDDLKILNENKKAKQDKSVEKKQKNEPDEKVGTAEVNPAVKDSSHIEYGSPDGALNVPDDGISETKEDAMPVFGNGKGDLQNYLATNLRYPADAMKHKTRGKVMINFTVNKEGKIENIKVLKPLEHGCTEEAVRVIEKMPNWRPGRFKGRNVAVTFVLPVEFNIR